MAWKERLRDLETQKLWEQAINFMEQVVKDNTDDVDAYTYIIFLLMNILVEEIFDLLVVLTTITMPFCSRNILICRT